MTNAGWYPDPAGAPDTFRYWDGQSWSQMTTSQPSGQPSSQPDAERPTPPPAQPGPSPYGAMPTAAPPTPPGPPYGGAPQWSPQPPPGSGKKGGKAALIAVAAVVVLALIGVAGFFGVKALNKDDDTSAKDDSSQASDDTSTDSSTGPSENPTDPTEGSTSSIVPSGIQCTGGNPAPEQTPDPTSESINGGGLSIARLPSYTLATGDQMGLNFGDGIVLQYTEVEAQWISLQGVGGLAKANGFDDPATAAEVVMQCLTGNEDVYGGFTGRTDTTNEGITVDGHPAHRITAEIRVSTPGVQAEGDVTDVIVVDTGNPDSFGLYLGMAAIGDDNLNQINQAMIGVIQVN